MVEAAHELGGAEIVGLRSALGLARRDHRVTVLAASGPVDPSLLDVKGLDVRVAEPTSSEPETLLGKASHFWKVAPRKMVADAFTETGPAIVHFHSGSNGFSASAFGPLARSGHPIVYTHHDYAWACPTQGFFHYSKRAPCGVRGGSLRCLGTNCTGGPSKYRYKLYRYFRHAASYRVSGLRDRVCEHVFVSPSSAQILIPYLPEGSSTQVVRNPVDVATGPPVTISAEAPVGYVGRMTIEKDPVLLAEAASRAEIPVLFVGDGPLLPAVKQARPNAEFTGWLPKDEVQKRIRRMRAMVLTSRWYEAQPLVITEAHAAGISVVAPTVCAGTESIEEGRTGLFYEAGDVQSLASALERLKDIEFCGSMGREAYNRYWADPPTLDVHLDAIEQVYKKWLSGR